MDEVQESHAQMVAFWRRAVRTMNKPEVESRDGLEFLYGNVAIPFFNVVALLAPVNGEGELATRIGAACEFAAARPVPWFLMAFDGATPGALGAARDAKLAEAGLHPAMRLTGMVAEHDWDLPVPPEGLSLSLARDAASLGAMGEINSLAYGMPAGAGVDIMDRPAMFNEGSPIVAYANGQAVSCAHTAHLDGRLYVAFVATLPAAQGRGFAAASMRQSLAEASRATGLRRSVLHATDAGRPIYERMGYRAVTAYTVFGQAHE